MNRLEAFLISMLLAASAQAEPMQDTKAVASYVVAPNVLVTKVCIGDQFYLITRQSNGASAITPALREGKPEQCDEEASK